MSTTITTKTHTRYEVHYKTATGRPLCQVFFDDDKAIEYARYRLKRYKTSVEVLEVIVENTITTTTLYELDNI